MWYTYYSQILYFLTILVSFRLQIQAKVYFADPKGHDNNNGDLTTPFATIKACVASLKHPGDECRLRGGHYHEPTVLIDGLNGTPEKPFVIAGYNNENVLIDGTIALPNKWKPGTRKGVWMQTLEQDIWQLFIDNEMQTPARWPNAVWKDKTVFNYTYWSSFDLSAPWKPKVPVSNFYDEGALGRSGIDSTDAIFIGNIAHMDTFTGHVVEHKPGQNSFKVEMSFNKLGNNKASNSIYYFEGTTALLDQPTEWVYDSKLKKIFVFTDDGNSPENRDVRGKIQTYILNITNCPNLVIANMSFFATTINAFNNIGGMRWESLNFSFPSFSRRMLGETHTSPPTILDGGKGSSEFRIFNCTWFGADGPTLKYSGTNPSFINNQWAWNDFSAADDDNHTGLGGWILDASHGSKDYFYRNTFWYNGPSVGYACGHGANMQLNHFVGQAALQNDGALIQIRAGSAANTIFRNNWSRDSIKDGIRLDSGSNSEVVPEERNNSIIENVIINTNGMELKNDYNQYNKNLALGGPPGIGRRIKNLVNLRVRNSVPKENAHSLVQFNIADSWTDPLPGLTKGNALEQNVSVQLRDPSNLDFRPRPDTIIATNGAGPYDIHISEKYYWIPGRQEYKASTPIPPHQSTDVMFDADLMFLEAYGADHHILYWKGKDFKIPNGVNVFKIPEGKLKKGTYQWTVDAVLPNGHVYAGDSWQFTVNHE